MTKRNPKLYISDILEAIEKIKEYTEDLSFEEFEKDEKTIDAVVRNFEIIGEAAGNVPEEIKMKYLDVDWRDMIAMRNILAHEYFQVGLEIIWDTIEEDIPKIKLSMKNILDNI